MPLQPPAGRVSILRKDRSAARHRKRAHQIVLNLISLQRRREQLIHLDYTIRSAMRGANPQHEPIPHIQQAGQNGRHQHESNQPPCPFAHDQSIARDNKCQDELVTSGLLHNAGRGNKHCRPKADNSSHGVGSSPAATSIHGGYSRDGWFSNDFCGGWPIRLPRSYR